MSLPRKQTKKQLQDFNNEVVEILEFYGAKEATNLFGRPVHEVDSERLGRLTITLSDTTSRVYTIFTRFEEPEKVKQYFNCNPHSGKYNSHEFTPESCLVFIDSLLDRYNQINGIDSHRECMEAVENVR